MAINAETENSSLISFNVNNKGDDAFKTQMLQTFLKTNTNNDIVLNTQLILERQSLLWLSRETATMFRTERSSISKLLYNVNSSTKEQPQWTITEMFLSFLKRREEAEPFSITLTGI